MLFNLHKSSWANSLKLSDYTTQHEMNVKKLKEFSKLTALYNKWIKEETKMTREEFVVHSVGKLNPQKHLQSEIEESLNANVMDCLGSMVNTVVFWWWLNLTNKWKNTYYTSDHQVLRHHIYILLLILTFYTFNCVHAEKIEK